MVVATAILMEITARTTVTIIARAMAMAVMVATTMMPPR
jgi:hypothetical protein